MATWATAAKAQTPQVARKRPKAKAPPARRAKPRPRPRPRVTGVLWIGALAVLLAGVVAMNVAVLRLNITLDRLGRERADLRATNAELNSRISSNAAAPRIQAIAARRLGLVPAAPDQTTNLRIDP
jgi:cell division protein FtsL